MTENKFYHCFPRHREGRDSIKLGLRMLQSMVDRGLLLAPEQYDWSEPWNDGEVKPYRCYQKRICFTDLSISELPIFFNLFGRFALEFSYQKFRILGAMSVSYLPLHSKGNTEGLEMAGAALLARLSEIQKILESLANDKRFLYNTSEDSNPIKISHNDSVINCSVRDLKKYIEHLEFESQPVEQLVSAIRAISNLFYAGEDPNRPDKGRYYKQREWRILSDIILNGNQTTTQASKEDVEFLLDLDNDFFSKSAVYPPGESYSRAEQCCFFKRIGNKHVLEFADRIIVPKEAQEEATKIVSSLNSPPYVDCIFPNS